MLWQEAYKLLLMGKKIKLPEWKGYWAWEEETIMIHLASGDVMDIRDTPDTEFTFKFIARDDWEEVEVEKKYELLKKQRENYIIIDEMTNAYSGKCDLDGASFCSPGKAKHYETITMALFDKERLEESWGLTGRLRIGRLVTQVFINEDER